jgi:glycosyltransferase involved in cell wall biosynthesis
MEIANRSAPTVWMNVTTSANWTRPPVGIVRVEQALCHELEMLLGKQRFKRCIWLDGEFVEWSPVDPNLSPHISDAIDAVLPKTASFDLARLFLANAFKRFEYPVQNTPQVPKSLNISVPPLQSSNIRPTYGDILISVGLDWDQPYTKDFYLLAKNQGIKVITCCYDLIPVLFPQYCVGEVAKRFKEYFTQLSWGSAAVLCISKQTQLDYLALCAEIGVPERPTCVIPLGDNVPSEKGHVSDQVAAIAAEPFILFVSTIERRKNHEVLYRAYHLLARGGHGKSLPKLVFVGMPGWGVGDLLKDIELDPLTQGLVIQLNHLNDADLNLLYKQALFCVYPSLYEGWGLPVGEALALGKAVVASAKGSLPEVGGDLVHYLDPWNAQAWADVIWDLVQNPSKVRAMAEKVRVNYKKRTWTETALSVKKLIDEIASVPEKPLVLMPGYDMSTIAGIHVGPAIVSTGANGFLMFGPHRSLAANTYEISIWATQGKKSNGKLNIEFASNKGQNVHYANQTAIDSSFNNLKPLAKFEVKLDKEVDDFEIRCEVSKDLFIQLDKVEIKNTRLNTYANQ